MGLLHFLLNHNFGRLNLKLFRKLPSRFFVVIERILSAEQLNSALGTMLCLTQSLILMTFENLILCHGKKLRVFQ